MDRHFDQIEEAVLRALVYADIFDYPLTRREIGRWMISGKSGLELGERSIGGALSKLVKRGWVSRQGGFYCLRRREGVFQLRRKRKGWSRRKWQVARRVAGWLKGVPGVRLVTVTGALAMDNCTEDDDIDLMVVTASGWLWAVRLEVILLLEFLGVRRRQGEMEVGDKICVNVWLEKGDLRIEPGGQGLYLAHEVLQAEPIGDRGGTYAKFLMANEWVKDFLPNAWRFRMSKCQREAQDKGEVRGQVREKGEVTSGFRLCSNSNILERLAYGFQRWHMRGRRTREVVTARRAFFHPEDAGRAVMRKYKEKFREFLAKNS